jgi:protein O-mannosyl-transferase
MRPVNPAATSRVGFRSALTAFVPSAMGPALLPFVVGALTFLVFSPALLNRFVEWDDQVNLLQNSQYRGLGWTQIRWMFTSTLMGHYIPVTWLTFGLDYTLWGMNPVGYHLTNNLIHAINAVLFYLVAVRVLGKATALSGAALRSSGAMAAMFFALHPLRAESVAWATERRDVLAGLFFLLTILMYLDASQADGPRRRRLLAGSLACYVLALLSKSIVMTLPMVLILLDLYPLGRLSLRWGMWRNNADRSALWEKLPYLVLGLAGALTAYWAVASHRYLTDLTKFGWSGRFTIVTYSLWFYLEKNILPLSLSPVHELPTVVNPFERRFTVGWIAVIAISVLALALRRRWRAGLALWAYYVIILGPVSGLVHAGHQLTHDRYSYISCLGWALPLRSRRGQHGEGGRDGRRETSICPDGRGGCQCMDPGARGARVASGPGLEGYGDAVELCGRSGPAVRDLSSQPCLFPVSSGPLGARQGSIRAGARAAARSCQRAWKPRPGASSHG